MNRFYLIVLPIAFLTTGCQSSQPFVSPKTTTPPAYTITYIIHGDANYLYHDADGNALQADEHILAEAKKIAAQATSGEVFIFHLQPERKILWLFPRKDRKLLYYRNGELVHEQIYSPQSKIQPFTAESQLYQKLHLSPPDSGTYKNIILYFGHEVPQKQRIAYHQSRPEAVFDIKSFAAGLRSFLTEKTNKFDLTVLSTCNNGTPAMVHALSPFTDYILASPQNLHLSHIDTEALHRLEQPGTATTEAIADSMATQTYRRMASFLQTVVALSVYNTGHTKKYVPEFNSTYSTYLANNPAPTADNVDCANFFFYEANKFKQGVQVWYKAPRFGTKNNAATYSGWGCRK